MNTLDAIRDEGLRAWFYESDLPLIIAALAGFYAMYAIIAIALGYPFSSLISALATLTFFMAIYAMAALALNLHWGYTGLFNIGIAGFMAVGVYVMLMLSSGDPRGATDVGGLGLPLIVGIIGGMVAAGFVGLLVGLPALRLRADYFAIVTLAAAEIIRLTANSSTLREFTIPIIGTTTGTNAGSGLRFDLDPVTRMIGRFAQPFYGSSTATEGYEELMLSAERVFGEDPAWLVESVTWGLLLLAALAAIYWLLMRVGRSPFGRVLKAIRDDEDVANSLGKNTAAFKLKGFVLGCALMGLVGILWRLERGYVSPDLFDPEITFFIWIALILGGVGSNTGAVIGGMAFIALLWEGPRYVRRVVDRTVGTPDAPSTFGHTLDAMASGELFAIVAYVIDNLRTLQLFAMGAVLIVLLQRRPDGLLGHRVEEASAIPLGSTKNNDIGDNR